MLFNCPHCNQMLKAADDAGGKKCRCTNCQELVLIPGGAAKTKPTGGSASNSSTSAEWSARPQPAKPASSANRPVQTGQNASARPQAPVPKPTVASELDDIIVRQHDQLMQQAAVRHQQLVSARRRSESRPSYAGYSSGPSSSSPVKIILTTISIIGLLLVVVCCGLMGFAAFGNSQDLIVGNYVVSANGHGNKRSSSFGDAKGEGIINRFTGSEFWIYSTRLPSSDPSLVIALKNRFGENCTSQQTVQRGNLSGTRYSGVRGKSVNLPQGVDCEMEVLIDRDLMIVTCYIPGSQKQKAGLQKPSKWESFEESWDRPESFFSSLRTTSK